MSGDVQPRKRKDKKKKKDEEINDDINIHVHKDGGTGGNICSKIVFFFLFSTLILLIGLIIKENQGLNEQSIEEESRFSQIFEGWIEEKHTEHDDKDDYFPESDEHDDGEDDDEDDGYGSEEDDHLETTEEVEESHEADEEEEDIEEVEESATRSEEEETVEETEEDLPDSEEEEKQTEEISEENIADNSEAVDMSEEVEENEEEAESNSKEDDKKAEESKEDNEKLDVEEEVQSKQNIEDEMDIPIQEVEKEMTEKEKEQPEESKEPSTVATKIGVGIALLTVAYNVFLRKRSDSTIKPITRTVEDKEPTPDLSRRNTIIPPPSLQEIEPDLPEAELDEEYSGDEEYSDEDNISESRSPREEYQELRTAYSRSLSPEGDFEVKDKHLEQEVLEDEMEELEPEEELEEEFDEEVEEEESDQYDDDEELLKRLEVKYGKLGREVNVGDELQSESDGEDYEHSNITSKDDSNSRTDIDAAEEQLQKNAAYANKLFDKLLDKYPLSPRVLYGKARALDIMAEEHQSNDILNKALHFYSKALNVPNVPDTLFLLIAERYIDRATFIGQYKKAIGAHWQLIERFPENVTHLNNLAVTYLTINMLEEARSVLKKVLTKWPEDGFAMVHYGFILKMADNDLEGSIEYLDKGIKTKDPGIDGRFFLYLGDSLLRLNRREEANKIHEEGVKQNVFLSKYQRSLYNVRRLKGKPWWQPEDLPSYQGFFTSLKDNWKKIRYEGLSALNEQGFYEDEAENLKDKGTWKQLELFSRGHKSKKNCRKTPITCGLVQKFSDASSCRRGQTKFSVIHPGTHVWPHCGPTNCRLRVHLGLKVSPGTFIRVGDETRSWEEGEIIIFDDSFEHEVWHNGSEFRLVLIVDVWHPDLTPAEKKALTSI
ncbi:aspartyl/asparaginyl beta-hydroxylase isoform X2 [Anthonomus grandis grandis]|uniref:aspartyl/asparaginyl beta-hydroxylase isoform X2 n=1 Tax=Anthonomus grandis grandis TaxID=2921223 RepID=UPI002164F4EF|nr:aspartyl/asparaginyl beta-hydroxylase isoform X2 [Anthonomus grandis grandis]